MDVRDVPGLDVRERPLADLALADQVAEGGDGLLPRGVGIDPVDVVEIDVIGPEARQARVHGLHHVPPRQAAIGDGGAGRLRDLGREHPAVARGRDRRPDHRLRAPAGVHVGRVDEVDAVVRGVVDDAPRLGGVRELAEQHGAEAELRHLHPAPSEHPIPHVRHGSLLDDHPTTRATVARTGRADRGARKSTARRVGGPCVVFGLAGCRLLQGLQEAPLLLEPLGPLVGEPRDARQDRRRRPGGPRR